MRIRIRGLLLIILAVTLTGSLAYAGMPASSQYKLPVIVVVNGSGNTSSLGYKVQTGTLGQGIFGSASSSNYNNSGGFVNQVAVPAGIPAADLGDAYVYPNPFKPNSPGIFQAAKLTFKHLPAEATIKIFAITGKQVAELHKTDRTVDHYDWNATNNDGQKLASGVYLFFMTAPNGGKARGKFAIIR